MYLKTVYSKQKTSDSNRWEVYNNKQTKKKNEQKLLNYFFNDNFYDNAF